MIDAALCGQQLQIPPVVLTELLSEPALPSLVRESLLSIPILDLPEGYWVRAGDTRAKVLKRRQKARVADCLIAQCCVDNNVALITRDSDFRHFTRVCGLRVALNL